MIRQARRERLHNRFLGSPIRFCYGIERTAYGLVFHRRRFAKVFEDNWTREVCQFVGHANDGLEFGFQRRLRHSLTLYFQMLADDFERAVMYFEDLAKSI